MTGALPARLARFIAHQNVLRQAARARNSTLDLLERFDYFAVFWGVAIIGILRR